ncbi:MAG: DUF421 domain-containing protein [bacterium]|nr:DUF421 domain-containing protein [bacterium]
MQVQYWFIPLTTILSFIVLFLLSKILGCRTISSMSMFDYINSIAIGSIAAQLSIAQEDEIVHNMIAMVLYGVLTYLSAILSEKFKPCRKILVGHPIVLVDKGKYYFKNFKRAHLEMEEFQAIARFQGYFDMQKIDSAILETTGQVSIIPTADEKPVVASDINITPEQEVILANIILDGEVCKDNLKRMGKDQTWLDKEISRYKITSLKDIFLATLDENNTINFYIKAKPPKKDIL